MREVGEVERSEQVKCEACGIRIGEDFEEQTLTSVTVRIAVSFSSKSKMTPKLATLWVCSSCLASSQRRAKRTGIPYLTPPISYRG